MIKDRFDVHVPSSLQRNTPIYRIIDFFSAAHLVTSNSLYIPIAEQLKDPNEGIDATLDHYALSAGPCPGITPIFKNIDDFKEHQQRQKRLTYVSCWSRIRESVAMWALYSSDSSSVQITTTVGQLEDALRLYYERNHDPRNVIDNTDTHEKGQFIRSARITPLTYLSILGVSARINRRRRAYDKLESKGLIKMPPTATGSSRRDVARLRQYKFAAFELKDSSFAHEMETRAVIEAIPYEAECLKIAKTTLQELYRSTANARDDWMYLEVAQVVLSEEARKKELFPSNVFFLPVPQSFIIQVSIDPRCDAHKQEFMTNFFRERGIPVVPSACFGYAANLISIQPRNKLLSRASNPLLSSTRAPLEIEQ